MARNAFRSVRPALLLALALVLTACTTPEIIRETPQPSPTATATLVPIETPEPPTSTSVAAAPERTIERIAFATTVDNDDGPEDERSVIPEEAERFYICIQASNVTQGSRFEAIWFEDGQIIGQSEKLVLEDSATAEPDILEEVRAREALDAAMGEEDAEDIGDRDKLFREAAEVVVQHQQGSTSLLQRRLKVGYGRAARIIDQLHNAGVLGPPDGSKPRDVLVGLDELDRIAGDLRFPGIEICTNVNGDDFDDPRFLPFFERCRDLDLAIVVHPNGFTHGDRLASYYLINSVGMPLDSAVFLARMIFGGVLERVPERDFEWKPHAKSMSLGELSGHLANLPMWCSRILESVEFDLASLGDNRRPQSPASHAALIQDFDAKLAAARALLRKLTDAELLARWTLKKAGQEVFSLPRISAVRTMVLNHSIHQRGQLTVYLRLREVPLPVLPGQGRWPRPSSPRLLQRQSPA